MGRNLSRLQMKRHYPRSPVVAAAAAAAAADE